MALGLLLSNTARVAAATLKSVTHTVVIDGMRFEPQVLAVKVGDTVIWTNHDPFPHTATAQHGQFDSHEIAPGRSWTYVARKAGVFDYACALHSTMVGTLRVE